MELIDTHCHLTFEQLAGDIESVLTRSRNAGVGSWITIGTDIEQSRKAVEIAGKFQNIYAAVGIHPHHAEDVNATTMTELEELAADEKVVAIGETGLDYHYDSPARTDQKRLFVQHLKLAERLKLPVVLHSRNAFDETVQILEQFGSKVKKAVWHCFSYSARQAKELLNKGFYISFTGIVTFRNAGDIREAADIVPLEKMMLESDCPYLLPEPVRKQKTNEPAFLIHTARYVAQLKQMDMNSLAEKVTSTSRKFFGLPDK